MTGMIDFYTNPMSRGQTVRWMLEESGAPYTPHIVDYGEEMKGAAYRAINPMGKVPAIVHDGAVVTECPAICAYLADAFPAAGLGPQPSERAAYYRWLLFAAGPIEQAVTAHAMGWTTDDPQKHGMLGYGTMALTLEVLTAHLTAHPFVTGDRFTAADVIVGAQVMWGMQFGSIPGNPVLAAYGERLGARPAYQRAKATDDALIAAAAQA